MVMQTRDEWLAAQAALVESANEPVVEPRMVDPVEDSRRKAGMDMQIADHADARKAIESSLLAVWTALMSEYAWAYYRTDEIMSPNRLVRLRRAYSGGEFVLHRHVRDEQGTQTWVITSRRWDVRRIQPVDLAGTEILEWAISGVAGGGVVLPVAT